MSKKKITYLLGAGASAQTIPTVAKFREGLNEIIDRINSNGLYINGLQTIDPMNNANSQSINEDLKKHCSKILEELENFSSIDTFARFLYFTNLGELPRLKALVNFCFSFWQHTKGLDKRYDSLFSFLVKGQPQAPILPDGINIVTWNYDLQIESSLSRYFQYKNLKFFDRQINIFPSSNKTNLSEDGKFCIFKLNGSSQSYFDKGQVIKYSFPFSFYNKQNLTPNDISERSDNMFYLLKEYYQASGQSSRANLAISYSWENDDLMKHTRDLCFKTCSDTEILVVIGYSFPLINREMDEKLISSMKKLEKVYVQSPPETVDGVAERCGSILGDRRIYLQPSLIGPIMTNPIPTDRIQKIDYVNEFFVPDEAL